MERIINKKVSFRGESYVMIKGNIVLVEKFRVEKIVVCRGCVEFIFVNFSFLWV